LIFQRDTVSRLALRLTMSRIAATLTVVGALLFSAGAAWAEETNDISNWLKSEDLEKFEEQFLNNDVTLGILPELTDAELKEIGIDTIGARKRILRKPYEDDLKASETEASQLEATVERDEIEASRLAALLRDSEDEVNQLARALVDSEDKVRELQDSF